MARPLRCRSLLLAGRLRAERPVDAVQAYRGASALGGGWIAPRPASGRRRAAREVAAGGLQLDVKGDALLSDLKVVSVERPGGTKRTPADRELLTWQSLAVNGLGSNCARRAAENSRRAMRP